MAICMKGKKVRRNKMLFLVRCVVAILLEFISDNYFPISLFFGFRLKNFNLCYIVIRSLGDSGRGCTINAIIPRNRASHVNLYLWGLI